MLWYYVFLCIAVTACFLACNSLMLATGRDLIWTTDAQPLYVNFLTWWVDTTRSIVGGFMSGNAAEIPDFTYSLGYGADVPMTMGSYLQDPLNAIALAFPTDMIAIPYALMTWLRMELAAVAFSAYCFSRGHSKAAVAVAALAYATCGYVLFWGMMRHSKFIDWAVLVPLIFLGADKLFERKSPLLLGAVFALQFFISVYTAYMSCLALLVYCLIKYFLAPRQRSARDFALLVLQFFAVVFVAFLVSALFSVPQVGALLGQGRATSGSETDSLFTVKYYAKIPIQLIGGNVTTNSLVLGAVWTFTAIAFLMAGKKLDKQVRRPWQVAMALCVFGILVPFVGHVFNGMGYSTDRWGLLIGFVFSYIICLTVPLLPGVTRKEWKRIGIGSAAVGLIAAVFAFGQVLTEDGVQGVVWPLTMTLAFAVVVVAVRRMAERSGKVALSAFMSLAVIVCTSATCVFYCSPLGENWMTMFSKSGAIAQRIDGGGPAAPMDDVEDRTTVRFSYPCVYDGMKNSSLTHGTMAVDFYSSFYNQKIDDFRQELGISDHYANFSYVGSDSRLALDAVTGVGYYVSKAESAWRLPYSYEYAGVSKGEYDLSASPHSVPLAFAADSVISHDEYDALSMVEKQEALLQGVVLKADDVPEGAGHDDLSFSSQRIAYTVGKAKDAVVEDGAIHVNKKNAKVTLNFEGLPKSETYVCFENLDATSYSAAEIAQQQGEAASLVDFISDLGYRESRQYPITIAMNGNTKAFTYASDKHVRAGGKKNWAVNMGYNDQAQTSVTLKFGETGTYTFDSLEIICQPVDPIVSKIDGLAAQGLSDLQLGVDRMSATLDLEEGQRRVATFMVAHAPGWSVRVDGADAQVLDANTGFLGVVVEGQGHHDIEWRYQNPFAKTGGLLSVLGIVLAVAGLAARRFMSSRRGR